MLDPHIDHLNWKIKELEASLKKSNKIIKVLEDIIQACANEEIVEGRIGLATVYMNKKAKGLKNYSLDILYRSLHEKP